MDLVPRDERSPPFIRRGPIRDDGSRRARPGSDGDGTDNGNLSDRSVQIRRLAKDVVMKGDGVACSFGER